MLLFKLIYYWVIHWAEHVHALPARVVHQSPSPLAAGVMHSPTHPQAPLQSLYHWTTDSPLYPWNSHWYMSCSHKDTLCKHILMQFNMWLNDKIMTVGIQFIERMLYILVCGQSHYCMMRNIWRCSIMCQYRYGFHVSINKLTCPR